MCVLLLACRELDAALGLIETTNDYIHESRTGRNVQHRMLPLLRQSVYSRLAGYEDTNDAERLAQDPAMRVIVGRQGTDKQAASTKTMRRFQTEVLTEEENLEGFARLNVGVGGQGHGPHISPASYPRHAQLREPGAWAASGERWRSVPSDSVVFRYLERFHDAGEEAKREAHRAFIPSPNDALKGLGKVNAGLVDFVQSRSPHTQATLDMDACLVESHKKEALYSYKKYRAYQPLTTYWAEADLVVHSEFRDGNVPAGHQQLRVLKEALGHLPVGVAKVMLRSDTAGYQQELLRYCAEGRDERFGVIEFAVGVDVTAEFRRAVSEVAEEDWHVLHKPGSNRVETGQEWAEVNFVPNWIGHSKNSPEYRFMATRERLIEQPLPAMEGQMKMPFPAMELSNRGWFKVLGVVTNRTLAGDEVIWWSRQRCGKGEEVHSVLKSDLAGGRLPSRLFGANAAWWAIAVLAFNLSSAMKRLVLGGQWVSRRLKAVRFALIALPGRVMRHARRLIIRLSRDHPSYELLLRARQNILALAAEPYRA